MDKTTLEGLMNSIRKEFFALRNGMIADTLRKGGLEQKYIFGLQLPQIKDIAVRFRPEDEEDASVLAHALWADKECREARLLACHLMPPSRMEKDDGRKWIEDITTREEADIIAFRLIRYLPFASELSQDLSSSEEQLKKYTSVAIKRFL